MNSRPESDIKVGSFYILSLDISFLRSSPDTVYPLALVAAASPALSAPVPAAEPRAFLPKGELGAVARLLGISRDVATLMREELRLCSTAGKTSLETVIKNAVLASGVAVEGVNAIISKLFGDSSTGPAASGKRALADLSDAEFNTLLEWVNEKNSPSAVAARAVALGSLGKGVAGLVAGLAATVQSP
ncbi:hypothetical protein C8F04DRAFT_1192468 [Mycena alexandri]|uniref:Uncharacterized protein n=1 Tax=Mycena alexandri TaxID=1745969 RepID=A0AAD6SAV8_9AGAR|nr:hypothetical protein C8F04DRAFT_1192468 [Mycena alexandri]